jgi:hypothetical protein
LFQDAAGGSNMTGQPASKHPDGHRGRGRQAAFGFIIVTVWLDVLSLGVIIPVFAP